MRIAVDIYYHVPTKYKSMFQLNVTKAQYAMLNEGKDLVIKGGFRLFKKREEVVFAPVFLMTENGTSLIGVKPEGGRLKHLPSYYLSY